MTLKDLITRIQTAHSALSYTINLGFGTFSQFAQRKNFSMPAIWVQYPDPTWDFTNGTQQLNEQFPIVVHVLFQDKQDPKKALRDDEYDFNDDDTAVILDDALSVCKEFLFKIQDDNDDFEIVGSVNPRSFVKYTDKQLTGYFMTITIRPLTQDDDYCEC